MRRQLATVLRLPALRLDAEALSSAPRAVTPQSTGVIDPLARALRDSRWLAIALRAGTRAPQARIDSVTSRLLGAAGDSSRIEVERAGRTGLSLRVVRRR